MTARPHIVFFSLAAAVVICFVCLRSAETQSSLRRITNTTDEGISINPSISGDGRIIGFESTEDVAGAGGTSYFRAIRANISVDPPTFFQMGRTRANAPGISQDGSRIAFASKDDPLGTNADGNSEIFVFNGSNLVQVTNTTPGNPANRVTEGNFQPSMSDDGRFVAFSSNRNLTSQNGDGNLEVFVFDSVAAGFTQLTNSTGIVGFSDAKISGDGSAIACIRDPGGTAGPNRDLLRINRTNAAQTVLSLNVARLAMTYGRAISDDGARVVYSAETAANSTQVFYYDGRSGNVNRQVTALGARTTEVPLLPTISGDGRRIAFATRRALTGFSNSDASVELYTHDIPTGTFGRITNVPDNDADCFDGSNAACEVVSSLNDDGSTVVFNFPRALSGTVTAGLENKSEIYATGLVARPPFGALTSILNQASLGHEPSPIKAVAPDSIAAAFGSALANTTQQSQKQPNGEFPTNVGGTTVTVNGRAAQIFFVSPERVHFLVPPQTEIGNAEVVITNADGFASKGTVPVLRAAPGIFTKTGDGIGEGMILNADTLAEGPFDPSGGNLRLLIFSTGVRNGITRTVNIGGRVVTPEAVNASTEMPGLDEVRVRVPADLRGAGNVNLFIQADGRDSNPVTVKFLGDPGRNVLINEVLADPPDGIAGDANHDGVRDTTDDEFIELVNGTSAEVISLGGWTIRTRATGSTTENTRFTFASGTSLPAGEAIVVFGGGSFNPSDMIFGCAQVVAATTSTGLSLTNSGVTILIRDASGNLITEFSYGGSTGFAGDNNQSLTRSPDITGAYVQHTTAAGANGRRFSPGLRTDGTPFGNCPAILTSVTISPPSATINVGQTQQFTAQAFDQFGRVMTGVTITFSSDNTNVATVESVTMDSTTGVATANVQGRNPGTANITASATDGAHTVNSTQANLTVTGPSLSINDVSQSEGNAGTSTFTFTVSLSTAAPAPVTFDIATQDNTATVAGGDYVARSLTSQTIAAGQQTYTFDVTVNGDLVIEQTEAFFVNVSNVSGASVTDAQGVGTIVTDDIPLLSVNDVTREEGNTGTTTFTFTVSSNLPAPPEGITFDIATQDSSATVANNDYVARSLTSQSIPGGLTSYTFDVTVNGDTTVESNEVFFVNISNVSANAGVGDGQGVGTIQNDDAALMVISQIYGGGNNSGATFKNDFVELFNRGTTTIDLAGWSVQQASATGSTWSVTELCPIGSCLVAPGKYFLVKLAPANPTIGADLPVPDATGTSNLSATSGKVALVNDSIELTGSGCPFGLSIVDFVGYGSSANCSENSTDAPAHSNTTADFRKSGGCIDTNDNAADFVTATPNPRNSASPANDCSTGFRPDITINNVSISEGDSGTKTVDFTVALSAANNFQIVTVNYATADGTASSPSDYQSTSGQLMFNPGETSKPVTVTIVGDTTLESNETFFVNLTNPVNAVILDGQGQGTITEDEVAPMLSINDVSMNEGNSGTKIFQFTVSLSSPALTGGVTFDIATQDNSATVANGDYVARSLTSQTIPAGQQTYTFDVTVNGDGDIEPNETFFVNVTNISGATTGDTQGVGTIQTDDSPVLSINDVSMTEGDTGTKIFTFTISSTMQAPAGGITFDITTQDGTAQDDNPASEDNDYVANSTVGKIIAAGTTSTTFSVTVNGDKLVEPDETFSVVISNASGGMAVIGDDTGVGTIQNDDAALLVISQTYPGGGLSGATYQNDYIELFNQGSTTVSFAVTPYSVQFLSTTASTWAKTNLTSGTIGPGGYFLIQGTSGGANGAPLPTPDASGSLNLTSSSPSAGKVALVVGTTLLTGNCPGDDGSAPFNPVDGTVADLVGYGGTSATANHCYEGSGPAPFTFGNNTIADFRKFGGCQDTNDNAADFVTATPSPRNTSSPINDCTAADVSITKTDSPDPVVNGSNVTYTITVTNQGPTTANSVSVTDNLPANVTFVSCASTGSGVCAGSGNNRTITFTSLAAGASETITLVATANGPAGTPISNTATVSSTTADSISGNNSATTTTAVVNPTFANLSIVKTDSPDPVFPTGTLTYTLSVTNNGPDTAQSVVVTDTLSSDVTFVDCASNQGGVCGGTATSPTITFSSLANGVTATITIHVTVNSNVTAGTVFSNTASVTSATTDSMPGNNSDSEDTTVQEVNAGQLVISEFRTRGPGGASDEFVEVYNPTSSTITIGGLKIRASNNLGVISDRVTITAGTTLGSGCHYLVANTSYTGLVAANQTYGTGIADDGGIAITRANGTTIIDQVGMSAGSAYKEGTPLAPLTNNVEQSYEREPGGAFGNGTDTNDNSADFLLNPSSSNPQNSSSGCIDVTAADVAITQTDSPDPVVTGSNVTYTIAVTNNGPATAQSVVVTDNLPGSVTFVSCNSTGAGVCGGSGNNRTVTFTSLAPSASETITLVATANGAGGTTITNTATVASTTTESNSANNSATATTAVINQTLANLAITKSDSIDPVAPGGTLTYTLNVTNNGPDTAPSVVVTDNLSSDVTFIDCSSTQGGTCGGTATSPTISFTSLANGVTAIITIRVTVSNALTTGAVITNTASVTSTAVDSVSGNNSDTETTNVQAVVAGEILISEFRFRGSAGASDEFIELYNPTTRAIDISGFKIFRSSATGTKTLQATINASVILPSGCHYLLTNTAYDDLVPGDQTYSVGIADDGGIAVTLASGTDSTAILDQVGLSSGSAYKEGTPLASLGATNDDRTYERKPGGSFGNGTDTNNNSADFLLNTSGVSNPQNSSTGCVDVTAADLAITKSDAPDPVVTGSNVTYTITVTNNGPATAQSVVVTDNLPGSVTFVSCVSTGSGVCGGTGNNRTITFSSLAAGASETITLVATANGVAGSSISNTATVAATTTDPNAANNSATATTDVTAPTPPDLSIGNVTQAETNAGTATFTFTVSLSAPALAGGVSFTVNTADGTTNPATAPSDYVAIVNGSGSIAEGNSSTTVDVTVNGDTVSELNETFFVNITGVTGATVSDGQGLGTITNDDALPTFAIADAIITEGNAGTSLMTFTVTLTGTSQSTVNVNYATADSSATVANSDYDSASGTLNFVSGDTSETFTVTINGDTNAEGDEMFLVNLSGASGATIGDSQALGIIFLDDPFSIAVLNTAYSEDFNVLASSGVSATTPAAWTRAESGTGANDTYTANTGTSTAGDTYSYGSAALPADRALGGLRTSTLTPTIGAFYRNDTGSTINTLQINYTGEEWRLGNAGRTDRLDFQYSTDATSLTTGTWTDANTLDFTTPNTATAGAKDGNDVANRTAISNTISGLSIAAGATFWIRWTDPDATGSDDGLAIDDFSITAGIDTPALSINNVTQVETNSGTTTFSFTVSLTSPAPPGGVSFTINTADGSTDPATAGSDYVAIVNGSGSIAQNNTSTTVTVTVNGDTDIEPDETFFVNLSGVTGATVTDGQGLGTITNDDFAAASADLSLTKSVDDAAPNIGQKVIFTIKISNGGPDSAASVQVKDLLPAGLQFVSSAVTQGSYVSGTGIWTVGTVPTGTDVATLTITATVLTTGAKTNTAEVTAVATTDPDSNPNDGTGDDFASVIVTAASNVVINEIVTTAPSSPPANANDFIELFNKSATKTVDISGLVISYRTGASTTTATTFTMPGAVGSGTTTIAPNSYLIIVNGGNAYGIVADFNASGTLDLTGASGGVKIELNGVKLDGLTYNNTSAAPAFFATFGEGTAFSSPTTSGLQDYIRSPNGTDTDSNTADFRRNGVTASITPKATNPTLP